MSPVGEELLKPIGRVGADPVKDVAKIGERIDLEPFARQGAG